MNMVLFMVFPIPLVAGVPLVRWIRERLGHDDDVLEDMYNGRFLLPLFLLNVFSTHTKVCGNEIRYLRAAFLWALTIYWWATVLCLKAFFCIETV